MERSAVGAAAELGVTFVPYSPLGRGFLTGSFADAAKDLSGSELPPVPAPLHR
ncbi:aldo/keto reductase [Streptomyces tanashiensis]